ncbi:hypothetical protein E2562_018033 [Oryza meyeriana var. granulata]|uniref:CCHC-type domain-containing protein n=1 Tax=Oryza meyeriana var. granulata TaxID=110450 RepID=A0A6G1C726_9ORYZ|nr:hypothetical protein E2562_018033 [Oryza meyeriana var. granulata]
MTRPLQGASQCFKSTPTQGWKPTPTVPTRPAVPAPTPRPAAPQYHTLAPTLPALGGKKNVDYFNCGEYGHYANNCPKPRGTPIHTGANATAIRGTATPTARRGLFRTPQQSRPAQGFGHGHVNHVRAEEA